MDFDLAEPSMNIEPGYAGEGGWGGGGHLDLHNFWTESGPIQHPQLRIWFWKD